jgi:SMODS-associated and fused to various effectors sensor domain
MAQANVARIDGDTFQARHFWRKACRLLDPCSPLARIGFESGPKGYDDIWVEYVPNRGLVDQFGKPLLREHTQCKWHVAPNSYGHQHLAEPTFINANSKSLLQRALSAQRTHAVSGEGVRFQLLTNWRIDLKDPLRELIHQRSHTLRIDRLFAGGDRSAVGALRKLWCEHLGIDESELRLLAQTLAFSEATDSLDLLRENLDPFLHVAGLRRIPPHQSAFIYDQVVYQWMAQGRLDFDRESLREACRAEGLLGDGSVGLPPVFGIKSFEHATDRIEDRCSAVLNLLPEFLERQIRPDADWQATLYPRLKEFLLSAAKAGERLRLILDAHLTLSFAAGSILNRKSGRIVEIEQRTLGKSIWAPDDVQPDPGWPKWSFEHVPLTSTGSDIVVAVSLTHAVTPAVLAYAQKALPAARTLLSAAPSCGANSRAVLCGRHAFDLAEQLTAAIKDLRQAEDIPGRTHLFIAGPGAFVFYLGQQQAALGRTTIYEFDFEGVHDRSYQPSLAFPVT